MLETLLMAPAAAMPVTEGVNWTSASPGISIQENVALEILANAPSPGGATGAVFGSVLPDDPCYFDIELASGYELGTNSVSFIGLSSDMTAANWDYSYTNQKMFTWYWSGGFYGVASGGAPDAVYKGVHRFAINRSTNTVYCKRISGPRGASLVGSKVLPASFLHGVLRPIVFGQKSYYRPVATLRAIEKGSGGLY